MAAVLGIEMEAMRDIAGASALDQVCDVANDNAPGQIVISGNKVAVERAMELARDRGAKRAILLPVSAPFHSRLMIPAADIMHDALAAVPVHAPVVPLVCNVTARPVTEPEDIRRRLVEQVTGMVRWTESVQWLTTEGGVTHLAELGAGKVLSGLAKRIAPDVPAVSVGTPADVDAFVAELSQ
jgi:[acyl-carrier-protein] S-malonyltransferase